MHAKRFPDSGDFYHNSPIKVIIQYKIILLVTQGCLSRDQSAPNCSSEEVPAATVAFRSNFNWSGLHILQRRDDSPLLLMWSCLCKFRSSENEMAHEPERKRSRKMSVRSFNWAFVNAMVIFFHFHFFLRLQFHIMFSSF